MQQTKIFFIFLFSFIAMAGKAEFLMLKDTIFIEHNDTVPESSIQDTISASEQLESDFQDYIDTIYNGIDTFAWDNKMINSGHFESKDMKDTVKLVLVDSLKNLNYYHPFKNYITSGFGPRRWMYHFGIDIKLNKGDSVVAAFDGVVRVTKYDRRGFGNVVVIRHPSGLESIYGHLSKVLVLTNQKVKSGELIGLGGNSGRSTGSHLHFETRYLGEPFDPNCFIDFDKFCLKSDTLNISRQNFEYLIDIRMAKYCKVRKGDTLYKIARRYHTTIGTLCRLNKITTKTLLRIGRPIRYQ
jgi:hypothetical protein